MSGPVAAGEKKV